ncbi:MAG: serine/threonine protein kinase [Phycisphaerales bacterium]|nr:serine/threonine protein kinase [Phycisphaerales bacterium]
MTDADQPERPDEDLEPTLAESRPGTGSDDTLQPSHPAAWPFEGDDHIPKQIGQYNIIGVIGSGGMGAVYEATQERPRRRVALKVVKSGRASPAAMKRFQFEVEALAKLRHPGIAQIYEAGTWVDGGHEQPFFAMEYIPGARSLTKYADDLDLDTKGRLHLFQRICEAVHHGHQKGIIHRDLKPDNILVDRDGNPKIIDFGVARATDADMAITTLQTTAGQIIGTLQYMSPEQCLGDPALVDTRADVYSLGVILYELLCHELPYDVQRQAMLEAVRIIREDAPKRPSTVTRLIRGDLETISLKALEKQPNRRYDSAIALGRDISRYLDQDPIEARPPSILYQVSMFIRKHRVTALSAATVVVAITLGLIATSILWTRAADLNVQLQAANVEVSAQRDLAEDRLQVAKDLYRSQLKDTFYAVRDLDGAIEEKLRIASSVADYFDDLRSQGQATASDLSLLAEALLQVAEVQGGLTHGNLHAPREAIATLHQARKVLAEIVESSPGDVKIQERMALTHRREAVIHRQIGEYAEAIADLDAIAPLLGMLPVDHPRAFQVGRIRGNALLDQGDIRDHIGDAGLAASSWNRGLEVLRVSAEVFPGQPAAQRDYAHALRRVGVARADDDPQQALETLRTSRGTFEKIRADRPNDDIAHRDLAWGWYYQGWAAMLIPLKDESIDAMHRGWEIVVLRCATNPSDANARSNVTAYMNSAIEICGELDAMEHVGTWANDGAVVLQPVVEDNSDNVVLAAVLSHLLDVRREHMISAVDKD